MGKKERIQEAFIYLKSKGLAHTQKDVADKIGSSAPNVSNAFKGVEKFLTTNFLIRFNGAYNNIFSENWLLNGEGEMLAASPLASIHQSGEVNSVNTAGTTTINHGGAPSTPTDVEGLLRQCKEINENSVAIMAMAKDLMKATLTLQQDMRKDREEHFARSREWLDGSIANIEHLRDEIRGMIDDQTEKQDEALLESDKRIIRFCATYDPNSKISNMDELLALAVPAPQKKANKAKK